MREMSLMRVTVGLVLLGACAIAACSSSPPSGQPGISENCMINDHINCACSNGAVGDKICTVYGWSSCDCPGAQISDAGDASVDVHADALQDADVGDVVIEDAPKDRNDG
jgi:hypothetical protein